MVVFLLPFLSFTSAQLICSTQTSTKEKKICFDIDNGYVIDSSQISSSYNSVYAVESRLKYQEVNLGVRKRKGHTCKGYNFYRRCMLKYSSTDDQLQCRYARCSVCVMRSRNPYCPFCYTNKSIYCPAVEACSCPWKAGFGIWQSCRTKIFDLCMETNLTRLRRKIKRRRKKKHLLVKKAASMTIRRTDDGFQDRGIKPVNLLNPPYVDT